MKFSTERISDEYLALNSCGIENFFDKSFEQLREKGRVDYQLIYVAEGACHLTTDGVQRKAPKGSIILFRPKERQQYAFKAEDKAVSYYIHFTGSACEQILTKLGIYEIKTAYIGKNLSYEKTFEKMLEEYSVKQFAYNECCTACLLQLFSIAARSIRNKSSGADGCSSSRAAEACGKISENLNAVSVQWLAREYHLSIGRFSNIFKEYTGKPPHKYIGIMRMEKAKELLLNTDLPIGEIAELTGYYDQNYFSRIFKKMVGVSPKTYRG